MWFILSTAKTLADSDSLAFCQVTHVCGLLSECGLGILAWVFTMLDDRTVVCEQGMVLSSPCSAVPGCKLSQVKWGSSFHVSHASHVSRPCVAAQMDLPSDLPDLPSDLPVLASCQADETPPSISGKPRRSTSGTKERRKPTHCPELPAELPDLPDCLERAEAKAMLSDCNSTKPAVPKALPKDCKLKKPAACKGKPKDRKSQMPAVPKALPKDCKPKKPAAQNAQPKDYKSKKPSAPKAQPKDSKSKVLKKRKANGVIKRPAHHAAGRQK